MVSFRERSIDKGDRMTTADVEDADFEVCLKEGSELADRVGGPSDRSGA